MSTSLPGKRLPHTSISSGPTGLVNSRTAAFTYSSDVGTDYQCKLDDGDWLTCQGGQNQYDGLPDGDHTFSVRGRAERPAGPQPGQPPVDD